VDAAANFIQLDPLNVAYLFIVGFIGGLVSGFIGSGGAFVLTPAMMSLGVPGIVAVASNICHKFPKALVGAIKRARYGQVDVKLGLVMGVSAEGGVLFGAQMQENIKRAYGDAGSNLYVSLAFIVVLAIVGGYVLLDAIRTYRSGATAEREQAGRLARWVQSINIPYTMMYFKSLDARVSVLFTIPLGFATGLLAATIAVGGFIGVPGMHYVLGATSLMASATELVIAFVMGLGGTIKFAWSGLVDVRLAMIILAGSLFGIQLGAIGTTYVKPFMIKLVMGVIMVLVLFSRGFVIPVYLSELELIGRLSDGTAKLLSGTSFGIMVLALATGALIILTALRQGIREDRAAEARAAAAVPTPTAAPAQLSPVGRFERFLVATDGTKSSVGAVQEGLRLAQKCGARVYVLSVVASGVEHETLGEQLLNKEMDAARAHLDEIKARAIAAGLECETQVMQGTKRYEQIIAEADRWHADVIVMGGRSERGVARFLAGNPTRDVVQGAHCSVLVVPAYAEITGRRFVLASDGSRFGDAAAVAARNLAMLCGAPVTVISIDVPTHSEERRKEAPVVVDRLVKLFGEKGIDAVGEVPVGAVPEMVVDTAERKNSDLVILGSHGRTGFERLLLGSNAEQVLDRIQCAVLVVKSA
jgi:nucleotide-binding universal stress UspA family protein/uncharacterized membrane protein YfcA